MRENIVLYRGDTRVLERTLMAGGLPINLIGASVTMTVKDLFTKTETDGIEIALTGSGGEGGEITITINPEDTAGAPDFRFGYHYDIQVDDAGEITTPLYGDVIVLPDVTE